MIIYRAGLTGCLAAIINPDATILDMNKGPFKHKAVLRFRSDEISKATGIPFKKIKVTKHVFDDAIGKYVGLDPFYHNEYSQKVIGGIYDRSIGNMEPVTRWLAPDNFHEQMIDMIGDRIYWDSEYDLSDAPVINTLPLPSMLQMLGQEEEIGLDENYNGIYVTTLDVDIDCDVHQTVYFPDANSPWYRATLEGDKIIIECVRELEDNEWVHIPRIFAIQDYRLDSFNHYQNIGKIAPVDESLRREAICMLTEHHNIYSLGRTATWRNILLDDCLKDIHQINAMISKSRYERMLGK